MIILDPAKQKEFMKKVSKTQPGLSMRNVSPEAVAKRLDSGDLKQLREVLDGRDINANIKAQPMLEAMGIDKLDTATQKRFIREVLDLSTKKLNVKSIGSATRKIPSRLGTSPKKSKV
jgi:hypothetical protein